MEWSRSKTLINPTSDQGNYPWGQPLKMSKKLHALYAWIVSSPSRKLVTSWRGCPLLNCCRFAERFKGLCCRFPKFDTKGSVSSQQEQARNFLIEPWLKNRLGVLNSGAVWEGGEQDQRGLLIYGKIPAVGRATLGAEVLFPLALHFLVVLVRSGRICPWISRGIYIILLPPEYSHLFHLICNWLTRYEVFFSILQKEEKLPTFQAWLHNKHGSLPENILSQIYSVIWQHYAEAIRPLELWRLWSAATQTHKMSLS